ncbi:MAG: GNAT family N-acetyltransferase [Verrucomicrobiae bacterium]|nr:GNAT family N-acetyltransferase [Verrucomicrobiae bacterium]
MHPKLSPLTAGEIPELLGMMRDFYAHEKIPFSAARSQRLLTHLLTNPQKGEVLRVADSGVTVGYLIVTGSYSLEFGGSFGLLDEFYLRPEFRGQGLAPIILRQTAARARRRGMKALRLEVDEKNAAAIKTYLKNGFFRQPRLLMTRPL